MPLLISRGLLAKIDEHTAQRYPEEACGLLIGRTESGLISVEAIESTENTGKEDSRRRHYLIPAADWFRVGQKARSVELDIVGAYHSHPDNPAIPSDLDLENAFPEFAYLIASIFCGNLADRRVWILKGDHSVFEEETILCFRQ